MILNTQNLAAVFIAFSAAFKNGFARHTPEWSKIATMIPSTTEANLYAWLGQFPKLREWIGDRQLKSVASFNYQLPNKDFESTVEVPRPKFEDDTYGIFSPLIEEMGYAAAVHPDDMIFNLLAAGDSTLCYDGQFFFDTDHPVNGVATSNWGGGSGSMWVLLDTRRPIKPFLFQKRKDYTFQQFTSPDDGYVFMKNKFLYGVDARAAFGVGLWQLAYGSKQTLDATAFNSAVAGMMSLKSDEGHPLGVRPTTIVVGPSLRAKARELFLTPTLSTGGSNPNYQEVEVIVSPYLT